MEGEKVERERGEEGDTIKYNRKQGKRSWLTSQGGKKAKLRCCCSDTKAKHKF